MANRLECAFFTGAFQIGKGAFWREDVANIHMWLLTLWGVWAQVSRLRSLEGGMFMPSLYLAIVLRATLIPCNSSMSVSLLSLKGLRVNSAAINFLMSALMAVEEHSPPLAVAT